jgi:hypothetical protein
VTEVLFINADTLAAAPMSTRRRLFRPVRANFVRRSPIASTEPVSCSAPLITKIDPRMMMMALLNPANASAGVSTPLTTSATSNRSVMTSTASFSVAKRMIATTSKPRTSAICMG